MARAICSKCQQEFSWRAYRGSKLEDVLSSCCGAPAHGKPVNRIKSAKESMPCIMAQVQWKYSEFSIWNIKERVRVYLANQKGDVLFSRSLTRWYSSCVVDGYRCFTGQFGYRRMREDDYQRLLQKANAQ